MNLVKAIQLDGREDHHVVHLFFETLKQRVGMINTRWIMTDDADQFYNAWKYAFSDSPHKLLCTWHVDRAWRGAIASKIANAELQCQVYHSLHILAQETDINTFNTMLLNFEQQLQEHPDTGIFAEYFITYYSAKKEQWALCYRRKAGINTNMHVESFHRLLKYVYMKGRINKRVDKCIRLLLKIARDKGFERLFKLEKGKVSHRISCINQRHKSSVELSTDLIQDNGFDLWRVVSSKNPLLYYDVHKEDVRCSPNCPLRRTECDICIHQFSCTCPNSLVRLTICKHIHLLIRKLYQNNMYRIMYTIPLILSQVMYMYNIYNVHNTSHTITSDVYV